MRLKFYTLDVFTERRFGGNPLAVFTDAGGLSEDTMQQVARELNLSESVFIVPPRLPGALCRLRIFTPGTELPFAGHPTIGTAYLLALLGRVGLHGSTAQSSAEVVLEENVGAVRVSIRASGGKPVFAQLSVASLPTFGPEPPPREALADMLSLAAEDILDAGDRPQAVSCGLPFLFVPLKDRAALGRARLKLDRWHTTLERYWASHVFVFCRDPQLAGSSIRARMFAPQMGIVEDPATGAAAAALGGYLGSREGSADGTTQWIVEQGFEMGRPSLMHVEIDRHAGRIVAVRVGGTAVLVSEGELILE